MGEAKRRAEAGLDPRIKLTCYETTDQSISLRPAPAERDWMDATRDGFAYRCLPLAMANAHGWEILCPAAFEAEWTGSDALNGVTITPDEPFGPYPPVMSHFGEGILTFQVVGLLRTNPGVNLWVSGPVNRPKHAIAPLTGLVETDWSVASFTMNWKFTAPRIPVRFEKDEPFCSFFPIRRGYADAVEPELKSITDDRATYEAYLAWRDQRVRFIGDLQKPGTDANKERWQRDYFQGKLPDERLGIPDHQTKIRLKPFQRGS